MKKERAPRAPRTQAEDRLLQALKARLAADDRSISEIERLLKKKVEVRRFDGVEAGASKPRESRESREPREPRETRPPREQRAPRETREHHPAAPSRRQQEREEAYARNPDQPVPARSHHVRGHARKPRPVPALLMKRKVTQPA